MAVAESREKNWKKSHMTRSRTRCRPNPSEPRSISGLMSEFRFVCRSGRKQYVNFHHFVRHGNAPVSSRGREDDCFLLVVQRFSWNSKKTSRHRNGFTLVMFFLTRYELISEWLGIRNPLENQLSYENFQVDIQENSSVNFWFYSKASFDYVHVQIFKYKF